MARFKRKYCTVVDTLVKSEQEVVNAKALNNTVGSSEIKHCGQVDRLGERLYWDLQT